MRFFVRNFDYIFVCLIGFVTLLWFKGEIAAAGDFIIPLEPTHTFVEYISIWASNGIGMGFNRAQFVNLLWPYLTFWALLEWLGLAVPIIERIWIYLVFILPGLSMVFLLRTFSCDRRGVLIGSFFYMFSPYSLSIWGDGAPNHLGMLSYGAMPLMLGIFVNYVQRKISYLKWPILFGITSSLASPAGIPAFVTSFFPVIIYTIFYNVIIRTSSIVKTTLSRMTLCVASSIIANAFWIFPLMSLTQQLPIIKSEVVYNTPALSTSINFFDFLRGFGFWAFYEPAIPFSSNYTHPPLIIITLVVPLLAGWVILMHPRNRKILFFSFLYVVSIFLAAGVNGGLGSLYRWLFMNFPFFWIFRSPYEKFGGVISLCMSVLIAQFLTLAFLNSNRLRISKKLLASTRNKFFMLKIKQVVTLVLFFVIVLGSLPLVTGDVFYDHPRGVYVAMFPRIPSYYYELADYINQQKDSFAIYLPAPTWNHYAAYEWGYSGGNWMLTDLFHKPKMTTDFITTYPSNDSMIIGKEINDLLAENITLQTGTLLSLFNIKYIIYQSDFKVIGGFPQEPYYKILKGLTKQTDVSLVGTYGDLFLFENLKYMPNLIYATTSSVVWDGNITKMLMVVNQTWPDFPAFLTNSEYKVSSLNCTTKPDLEIMLSSATKYLVKITSSCPIIIVFNQSFDEGWEATIGKQLLPHIKVNGFANGWYIDNAGSFLISIEYKPQLMFSVSIMLSFFSEIMAIIFIVLLYYRNSRY